MILKGTRDVNGREQTVSIMPRPRRIPITNLNDHLTCTLCKGYFIDATTIIECLHSFCRSCIVKYLATNKYCPVCDVQVHKMKPLLNIRPDKTLQDIVYKLVPKLFQNEMQKRRQYYAEHADAKPSGFEQRGEALYQHLLTSDETLCISFNYYGSSGNSRYLRCPAAVTVSHLQKLIRAKYDLSDNHRVDIFHNQDCLNEYLTLMDIAYIYLWRRKGPMELTYRIYENTAKRARLEEEDCPTGVNNLNNNNNNNNDWKEVQLRISENGEMSVTGIQDCLDLLDQHLEMNEEITLPPPPPTPPEPEKPKKELPALKLISKASTSDKLNAINIVSNIKVCDPKTPAATQNGDKVAPHSPPPLTEEIKPVVSEPLSVVTTSVVATSAVNSSATTSIATSSSVTVTAVEVKRKIEEPAEEEPPAKQMKPTVLNHQLGLQNLSNNHPLKKHSLFSGKATKFDTVTTTSDIKVADANVEAKISTTSAVVSSTFTRPTPSVLNKTCIPNNRPGTPIHTPPPKWPPSKPTISYYIPKTAYYPSTSTKGLPTKLPKPPPMVYKTLRDPPTRWNPKVTRASLTVPKPVDSKNEKPAKFFKMRNNLPRYLGNPASGVKPMYPAHVSPEKEKKVENTEIKKHSIVKIDPKTLKPVSERAPDNSNLSNQTDLKINTSSVSIFNPLKLQCSPKNASPKSPQSPKKSTSPPTKRDKLNLNYTPPNPFIPNLTSPTINPNQFLYPSGPPGFPSYDPRVMAAYHNLMYGQRLPFAPNLLIKPFDLPIPATSPKLRPPSPFKPTSPKPNSSPRANSPQTGKTKPVKGEKTLQNALDKLTQNKIKKLEADEKKAEIEKKDVQKVEIAASEEKKKVEVSNDLAAGKKPDDSVCVAEGEKVKVEETKG